MVFGGISDSMKIRNFCTMSYLCYLCVCYGISSLQHVKRVARFLRSRRLHRASSEFIMPNLSDIVDIFRSLTAGEGMLEVTVLRGRNLVPKDSNGKLSLMLCDCEIILSQSLSLSLSLSGLSDPYIVIKYGSSVMFRTHVIEKCLNPEWNESVSLAAPAHDDIIKVVHTDIHTIIP